MRERESDPRPDSELADVLRVYAPAPKSPSSSSSSSSSSSPPSSGLFHSSCCRAVAPSCTEDEGGTTGRRLPLPGKPSNSASPLRIAACSSASANAARFASLRSRRRARRAARAASSSARFVAWDTMAAESRGAASESSVEEDMVGGGARRLFRFPACSLCTCSSSSSSSSGRRIGGRRPKRSQPKSRMLLLKCDRLRRAAPGFECRERVSASAVVALPESTRRSSRSLRSALEERRQDMHGAVRARRESDQENVSMSFPRWREDTRMILGRTAWTRANGRCHVTHQITCEWHISPDRRNVNM